MKLERTALLAALSTIKPAIASKDLVEELAHVWFDGSYAMAYNDAELGMQVPLETEFVGGIRGSLLFGLLHNSRAKDVEFSHEDDGNALALKAGRSHSTLTLLNPSRTPWRFPKVNKAKAFKIDEDFIAGMKIVLVSAGSDTTIPETLGVTLYFDPEALALYTTDSNAIASVLMDRPKTKTSTKRVILPTAFCEQVLRLCSGNGFFEVQDDCVLAGNEEGVLIYARIVDAPRPLKLPQKVDQFEKFPKAAKFEIPAGLSLALDRIGVLFEGLVGETMLVEIAVGIMSLSANIQGRGKLEETLQIPEDVPAITFRIQPALLRRALFAATHMVCFEDVVRLSGKNDFVYLASNDHMS